MPYLIVLSALLFAPACLRAAETETLPVITGPALSAVDQACLETFSSMAGTLASCRGLAFAFPTLSEDEVKACAESPLSPYDAVGQCLERAARSGDLNAPKIVACQAFDWKGINHCYEEAAESVFLTAEKVSACTSAERYRALRSDAQACVTQAARGPYLTADKIEVCRREATPGIKLRHCYEIAAESAEMTVGNFSVCDGRHRGTDDYVACLRNQEARARSGVDLRPAAPVTPVSANARR